MLTPSALRVIERLLHFCSRTESHSASCPQKTQSLVDSSRVCQQPGCQSGAGMVVSTLVRGMFFLLIQRLACYTGSVWSQNRDRLLTWLPPHGKSNEWTDNFEIQPGDYSGGPSPEERERSLTRAWFCPLREELPRALFPGSALWEGLPFPVCPSWPFLIRALGDTSWAPFSASFPCVCILTGLFFPELISFLLNSAKCCPYQHTINILISLLSLLLESAFSSRSTSQVTSAKYFNSLHCMSWTIIFYHLQHQ